MKHKKTRHSHVPESWSLEIQPLGSLAVVPGSSKDALSAALGGVRRMPTSICLRIFRWFSLLVLVGIYHYWTHFFPLGLKQIEDMDLNRSLVDK